MPADIRALSPAIAWRRIAGLRDILAHDYFGIDEDLIWDAVQTEVPALLQHLVALRVRLAEGAS